MKLTAEEVFDICLGAVRGTKTEKGVQLHRFTEEQENYYKMTNEDFYKKSQAAAGMKLFFETNSESLYLKACVASGSSRTYFSFDVFVNDYMVDAMDNYSDTDLPEEYWKVKLPEGEYEKTFHLGEGIKRVCIYLPWSVSVEIRDIILDDNAFVKPIRYDKRILVFGDSITQGYDALHPSNRYVGRICEALCSEEINKAIGKEIYCPSLAKLRDEFEPDYIIVSYGTNDWNRTTEEDFKQRCFDFFTELRNNYPRVPIFAITPIWRSDYMEERAFGEFRKVGQDIESIVKEMERVICIDGYGFVPHDEGYFADLRLHPNDKGFACFFACLNERIQEGISLL